MTSTLVDAPPGEGLRSRVIRAGAVSYLNTLPLIEGLGKLRDIELTLTAPSMLIDLLLEERIDIGLVSIVDALRSPRPLALVPAGMIGCDGPTMTVRLFSRSPIGSIRRIHADADSHTSGALVRILLAEMYGLSPELIEFDVERHRAEQDAEEPEAQLLIGDKVITDSPAAASYPHQLDLGQAWKQLTGLPFVYAIWMCLEDRAAAPEIRTAASILERQRRHNATRLDWIVDARAAVRGWPRDLAREYLVNLLRFEVTSEARQSIEKFFELCRTHGIAEAQREPRWV